MMVPSVLKKATPAKVNCPSCTRKPPNGMTASLGTGAIMLSSAIRTVSPG